MEIDNRLKESKTKAPRRSLNPPAHAGPVRIFDECNHIDCRAISLTLPCCGRVLCGPCTARALVCRWEKRCVVVCNHCQTAHTFQAPDRP